MPSGKRNDEVVPFPVRGSRCLDVWAVPDLLELAAIRAHIAASDARTAAVAAAWQAEQRREEWQRRKERERRKRESPAAGSGALGLGEPNGRRGESDQTTDRRRRCGGPLLAAGGLGMMAGCGEGAVLLSPLPHTRIATAPTPVCFGNGPAPATAQLSAVRRVYCPAIRAQSPRIRCAVWLRWLARAGQPGRQGTWMLCIRHRPK